MAGFLVSQWKSVWIANMILSLLLAHAGVISQNSVSTCFGLLKVSGGFTALPLLVSLMVLVLYSRGINYTQKVIRLLPSSTLPAGKCRGICWHVIPSSECVLYM